MAIDLDAIAIAIAARFDPSIVTPPAGYADVASSSANPPNQIAALPAILVFADSGVLEQPGNSRHGEHLFRVQLLYSQGVDLELDGPALRKWATVLLYQLQAASQLGGTVADVVISAWRIRRLRWSGLDYSGLELDVRVHTTEGFTVVS